MASHAPTPDADHNLLFGVVALQVDLISRDQFVEACAAWAARKVVPLADLLVERGWLAAADRAEVDRLVRRKLNRHGDARASLAAMQESLAAVEESLAGDHGAAVPPATAAFGTTAGAQYELLRPHARGGLGQVWLARDATLGREVALKELLPERAGQPAQVERFLREARITGRLDHPGIVPVHALGFNAEGRPYYVMRFIRGWTLTGAIAAHHASPTAESFRDLIGHFGDVCQAIAYAHSKGVLHRDLKSGNVLVGAYGETQVVDWGLAKLMGAVPGSLGGGEPGTDPVADDDLEGVATRAGEILGTPAYMAPEQAAGAWDAVGPAADTYALGAILYEILTGRPPYRGPTARQVLDQVRAGPPPPPAQVAANVPPALERACQKAMARQPEHRYPTAVALAREVEGWLAAELDRSREELRRAKEAAEAANRAKGVLLTGLSLELRGPLERLLGLEESVETLLRAVNALLDYCRAELGGDPTDSGKLSLEALLSQLPPDHQP